MRKMIAMMLAMLVLGCCLYGCGSDTAQLSGRWESLSYYEPESVLQEFEIMDLYEEEIAMLDPGAMGLCDVMLLNEDMTYTIAYDAEKTMALVAEYYRSAFATFYENREQLQTVYGEDFVSMTEAEFYQFYADMYGAADFEELITFFVGTAEEYAYLEESPETGTYRIALNRIYFTMDGSSTEEYVTFSLKDGSLTMEFNDATVTYSRG